MMDPVSPESSDPSRSSNPMNQPELTQYPENSPEAMLADGAEN